MNYTKYYSKYYSKYTLKNNSNFIHNITNRHLLPGLAVMLLSMTLLSCNKTGADTENNTNPTTNHDTSQPGTGTPTVDPTPTVQNLTQVPLADLKLQKPQTCTDFKNYVVTSLIKRHTKLYRSCARIFTPGVGGGARPLAEPQASPTAAAPPTKALPDGVSDTNNQVDGVNESDIVKSDLRGNVYIASGRNLIIADAFPPKNMSTLKELTFDGRITDLFLDKINLRLIVVARFDTPSIYASPVLSSYVPAPIPGATDIVFLDVEDTAAPTVIKQIRLPGNFQAGRRIENRLHLIFQSSNQFETVLDKEFWKLKDSYRTTAEALICANGVDSSNVDLAEIAKDPKVMAAKEALVSYTNTLYAPINIDSKLPIAQDIAADKTQTAVPLLTCADIQHPTVNANLNLQVISSVDTNGANLASTAMINNAWRTYVSKNNIYISETNYNWWWEAPMSLTPTSQTAIYKFAISKQEPSYVATGSVEGYVKDQFSFSEFNGDLRVATTQTDRFVTPDPKSGNPVRRMLTTNNVFVLRDDSAGNLNIIGSQRNFGKDETIRSVRFMGSRGFVVTFRSIDPLFAFDLSVPEAPNLMGELEIPGFSSYMQPFDDNHLVTIGRAPGANGIGTGNGIQLQLFDVSDLANPQRIHVISPVVSGNWSWSAAEYDNKAFTFYTPTAATAGAEQQSLLAIPLQYYDSKGDNNFSGVYTYNVSITGGFKLIGKVDHADLSFQYYCASNKPIPEPKKGNPAPNDLYGCKDSRYTRLASPRRSIIMNVNADNTTTPVIQKQVYIFTVSDVGMKANDVLNNLTPIKSILFPEQAYSWWPIRPFVNSGPVLRL